MERRAGEYDFSRYDSLVAGLERQGLRALLILDYANLHLRFARGREALFFGCTSDGAVRKVELRVSARRLRDLDMDGAYKRTLQPRAGRCRLLPDSEPIFSSRSARP